MPCRRGWQLAYLGLTVETVSRQMTNLRKAGIIEIPDRRSVRIPNRDQLALAAG